MGDLADRKRAQWSKLTDPTETNGVGVDTEGNLNVITQNIAVNGGTNSSKSALVAGKTITNTQVPVLVDDQGRLITSALTGFGADFAFGEVSTAATTRVVVKRTTYTEQVVNAQRSISSSSALDAAAGTGARTVIITYLDQNGVGPYTEVVTLNGLTAVNTVATNICFIEQMQIVTAGTGGTNAGILSLKAAVAGGGVTIGTIGAGDSQTAWAHHYVPAGKTCNITGISCSHNGTTVGSGATFVLRARNITANAAVLQISDTVRLYGQSSTFSRIYQSPIKMAGPAFMELYVTPESATATTYRGSFDFFEP